MTFSIAMRCPKTGMLGVAGTTSSLAIGSRCLFAKAGVGAVLSQHRTDPRLGPQALALMESGLTAEAAVAEIVAKTPDIRWRQLALIDAKGGVAWYHGAEIKQNYAAATGAGVVAIGNILTHDQICAAAVQAAEEASGAHLAERLILGLEAALAAGGEVFDLQSAAVLVVDKESFPLVDLRIDDAIAPLGALRDLWRAYLPEMLSFVERALTPEKAGYAAGSAELMAGVGATSVQSSAPKLSEK